MNRETKSIKTSSGMTIEYFAFINAKEGKELQRIFMGSTEVKADKSKDSDASVSFKATTVLDVQDKAVAMLTVSFNGNREGVQDSLDNLPAEDYNEYIEALSPILEPVFFGKGGLLAQSTPSGTPAKN